MVEEGIDRHDGEEKTEEVENLDGGEAEQIEVEVNSRQEGSLLDEVVEEEPSGQHHETGLSMAMIFKSKDDEDVKESMQKKEDVEGASAVALFALSRFVDLAKFLEEFLLSALVLW